MPDKALCSWKSVSVPSSFGFARFPWCTDTMWSDLHCWFSGKNQLLGWRASNFCSLGKKSLFFGSHDKLSRLEARTQGIIGNSSENVWWMKLRIVSFWDFACFLVFLTFKTLFLLFGAHWKQIKKVQIFHKLCVSNFLSSLQRLVLSLKHFWNVHSGFSFTYSWSWFDRHTLLLHSAPKATTEVLKIRSKS